MTEWAGWKTGKAGGRRGGRAEVGGEGRVSERNVQQAHTAATCTREGWSQAHPPASSPTTTKHPTAARISEGQRGQLQAWEGRAGTQQPPHRSMHMYPPLQSTPARMREVELIEENYKRERQRITAESREKE